MISKRRPFEYREEHVITLGKVNVDYGLKENDERVKMLFASFKHRLMNLDVCRFPEIDKWPEGMQEEVLLAINFQTWIHNIHWVNAYLEQEGYGLKGVPHLAAIADRVDWLYQQGVRHLEGTSRLYSLDMGSDRGNVCISLNRKKQYPRYRLHSYKVGRSRHGGAYFLVGPKTRVS